VSGASRRCPATGGACRRRSRRRTRDFSSATFDLAVISARRAGHRRADTAGRQATDRTRRAGRPVQSRADRQAPTRTTRDDLLQRGDLAVISHESCAADRRPPPSTPSRSSCAQDRRRGGAISRGCLARRWQPGRVLRPTAGRNWSAHVQLRRPRAQGKDCAPACACRVRQLGPRFRHGSLRTAARARARTRRARRGSREPAHTLRCRAPQWDRTRGQRPGRRRHLLGRAGTPRPGTSGSCPSTASNTPQFAGHRRPEGPKRSRAPVRARSSGRRHRPAVPPASSSPPDPSPTTPSRSYGIRTSESYVFVQRITVSRNAVG